MFTDLFRRGSSKAASAETAAVRRTARRSSGLSEFNKLLAGRENLTILDLGPTSPQNIGHITGLGHRVYNEDVLLSSFSPEFTIRNADGTTSFDVEKFLSENLRYEGQHFDAVLCWDIPDYLNEGLVKAAVDRISNIMKPGGVLLAFFHTKDAGPDAPYFRYHIADTESLDLQRGPQFRLQRIFNNRHIENLFHEFSNIKFFLARDNVREVLVVR
jgi:SAM-dependent methyltransferase